MTKLSPVLIIIFKRPDLTRKLIDRLKQSKITELYVVADGLRSLDEKY